MSFLIPDDVLDQLLCSICHKYLSVKPVKVCWDGRIKCGRCVRSDTEGVVSLFGNVVENGLFRCINRYEGCRKYLSYSEVATHEATCPSGLYPCSLCPPEKYKARSAYETLIHYKNFHKHNTLTQPEFTINTAEECDKTFIYYKNDYIFVIYVKCNLRENCLLLNASYVGPQEICGKITQQAKLYSLDKEFLYASRQQLCSFLENNFEMFKIPLSRLNQKHSYIICNFNFHTSDVDNFILLPFNNSGCIPGAVPHETKGLHNVYPKIFLSTEFKEEYPEYYLSPCTTRILKKVNNVEVEFPRICSFCENIFQVSGNLSIVSKCPQNHFTCKSCCNNNPECCSEGKCIFAREETDIYNSLLFYCKWNCSRFYSGKDLRYHEKHCKFNTELTVTTNELAQKYFSGYSVEQCSIHYTNVFFFDDFHSRGGKHTVLVITRDNFNFVLNCIKDDNNFLQFWVSHKYPVDKYYILIKIKEQNESYYYRTNSFSLACNNVNDVYFAVVLREIK